MSGNYVIIGFDTNGRYWLLDKANWDIRRPENKDIDFAIKVKQYNESYKGVKGASKKVAILYDSDKNLVGVLKANLKGTAKPDLKKVVWYNPDDIKLLHGLPILYTDDFKNLLLTDDRVNSANIGTIVDSEAFRRFKESKKEVYQNKEINEKAEEVKTEEPKLEAEEPKLETEEPKLETEEPKLEAEEPKLETEEPKLEVEEPKLETEEPKLEVDRHKKQKGIIIDMNEYNEDKQGMVNDDKDNHNEIEKELEDIKENSEKVNKSDEMSDTNDNILYINILKRLLKGNKISLPKEIFLDIKKGPVYPVFIDYGTGNKIVIQDLYIDKQLEYKKITACICSKLNSEYIEIEILKEFDSNDLPIGFNFDFKKNYLNWYKSNLHFKIN